jgi:hypothetical protein
VPACHVVHRSYILEPLTGDADLPPLLDTLVWTWVAGHGPAFADAIAEGVTLVSGIRLRVEVAAGSCERLVAGGQLVVRDGGYATPDRITSSTRKAVES